MKVSAKTEYACIAMLELAAGYPSGRPVQIRSIAARHKIPARFLVQILLQLKAAGLVASTRGAAGGYRLLRSPREISLGEVMAVIDGSRSALPQSSTADTPASRALQQTWREVRQRQQEMLHSITFAELLDRTRAPAEAMYHI